MNLPNMEDAWKRCADAILAIDDSAVQRCTVPREVATLEAIQLSLVATADRDALIGVGIDAALLDSLHDRAMAFSHAASIAATFIDTSEDAATWKEAVTEGYRLRKTLLKQLRFAFRDDPAQLATLFGIQEGRGHLDMMVDLLALHFFCDAHRDTLSALAFFTPATIDQPREMHARLNDLAARARIRPKAVPTAKSTFHRAWTFYKLAADDVKSAGRLLFEGTDRYRFYHSEWQKKLGKKGGKATASAVKASESLE